MRLDQINWHTITQTQARRLISAARSCEQAAARKWDASDSTDDEAAWKAALDLEENLRVFAICGEKPEGI